AVSRTPLSLFVGKVRGNAEKRFAVLRFRSQLYLERAAVARIDGRMNRLIAVRFGEGDIVLDLPGHRTPVRVDDAERRIAICDAGENNAKRAHVVDLRHIPAFSLELPEEAVNTFYASFRSEVKQSRFGELALEVVLDFFEALFVLGFSLLNDLARLFVFLRHCVGERGVFK